MNNIDSGVSKSDVALIAITRGAMGLGVGLLIARKLTAESCRAAGWALFAVGAATTIPLMTQVFASSSSEPIPGRKTAGQHKDSQRKPVTSKS